MCAICSTRTLEQRFNDGPAERRDALESAGYLCLKPIHMVAMHVCYTTGVAFSAWALIEWPPAADVDSAAAGFCAAVLGCYLLQYAGFICISLHWLSASVVSIKKTHVWIAQTVFLVLAEVLITSIALLLDKYKDPAIRVPAGLSVAIPCGQLFYMFAAAGASSIYSVTPSMLEYRRRLAMNALIGGTADTFVDRLARAIRPPVVDGFFLLLGGAFGAAFYHRLLSTPSEDKSGLYNVTYTAVAIFSLLFGVGVFLSLTRVLPVWNRAEPGHLTLRETWGAPIAFSVAASAAVAALTHLLVASFRYRDVEMAHGQGAGLVLLFAFIWWVIVVGVVGGPALMTESVARSYVNDDAEVYESLWRRLLKSDGAVLDDLTAACDRATSCLKSTSGVRQQKKHARRRFEHFVEIFRRSRLLDPLVQSKAKQWAASVPAANDHAEINALNAPLKTHKRAIEKVWRSYGGKPECLLDVSRCGIVCTSLEQVCALVATVTNDPDVSVLRCKNRFHPNYDSRETAGYRDISFNMVLNTREAAALDVLDVVFEVQLLLRAVYELKTDEGHANYRRFRNLSVV